MKQLQQSVAHRSSSISPHRGTSYAVTTDRSTQPLVTVDGDEELVHIEQEVNEKSGTVVSKPYTP